MGGERVAQRVGRHSLLYAGGRGKVADYVEHHDPRQRRPTAVQEQYVSAFALHRSSLAQRKVVADEADRHRRQRYYPLLLTFALHHGVAVVERYARHAQVDELRHAEPAAVERLDDGVVARRLCLVGGQRGYHGVDILHREDVGQRPPDLGRLYQRRRVVVNEILVAEIFEKTTNTGDEPRLCPRRDAHVVQVAQQREHVVAADVVERQSMPRDITGEMPHVIDVTRRGGRGQSPLQNDMPREVGYQFLHRFQFAH